MKNISKAWSYVSGKNSSIVYSVLMFLLLSSCLHFIKVSDGWLWEIRSQRQEMHWDKTEEGREVREWQSWVKGRPGYEWWAGERAKLRSVEGFSPGRRLPAFMELPIGQAGLSQMSCLAGVGASTRGCVRAAARGREWKKTTRSGRKAGRKTPDLVFLKPSSYIANAWSNMGLIHNG